MPDARASTHSPSSETERSDLAFDDGAQNGTNENEKRRRLHDSMALGSIGRGAAISATRPNRSRVFRVFGDFGHRLASAPRMDEHQHPRFGGVAGQHHGQ
jgi:hypothetical protein